MRQTPTKTPEYGAEYGAQNGAARGAPYPLTLESGGYGAPPSAARAVGCENGAEYGAVITTPAAQREVQTFPAAQREVQTTSAQREVPIINQEYITWRLEEAGRTLLALPNSGHSTKLRSSSLDVVQSMAEAYGWSEKRLRPPVPSGAAIDRMDAAYAWLALIPDQKYVLRRIVAARSLVHPLTERHLYPWRRLGTALGADHKAIQRWWAQGVDYIHAGLARR